MIIGFALPSSTLSRITFILKRFAYVAGLWQLNNLLVSGFNLRVTVFW